LREGDITTTFREIRETEVEVELESKEFELADVNM